MLARSRSSTGSRAATSSSTWRTRSSMSSGASGISSDGVVMSPWWPVGAAPVDPSTAVRESAVAEHSSAVRRGHPPGALLGEDEVGGAVGGDDLEAGEAAMRRGSHQRSSSGHGPAQPVTVLRRAAADDQRRRGRGELAATADRDGRARRHRAARPGWASGGTTAGDGAGNDPGHGPARPTAAPHLPRPPRRP